MNKISHQIKTLREKRGWSKADLARKMQKHPSVVVKYEKPDYELHTFRTLKEFAEAFDTELYVRFGVKNYDDALEYFYSGDGLDEAALMIQQVMNPVGVEKRPNHAIQVGIRVFINMIKEKAENK